METKLINRIKMLLLALITVICAAKVGLTSSAWGEPTTGVGNGTPFPTPYAGTYYPIYNEGVAQWIQPISAMPFDKVSAIFVAFAHAYPEGRGAILSFERGQVLEPTRLPLLAATARKKNPQIKILISLGWEHGDWDFISEDYRSNARLFVPSVIAFVRSQHLDGFDIDDEGIEPGGSTGEISQADFDAVVAELRAGLNAASIEDNKTYYLTITPAGNNEGGLERTQVDAQNAKDFDLINIQSYYDPSHWPQRFLAALKTIKYPLSQVANGIDTQLSWCRTKVPSAAGFAGIFNWNMTADSVCETSPHSGKYFKYTLEIANDVGY
jgi:hypothetical protein